jgi:hypothetical protein
VSVIAVAAYRATESHLYGAVRVKNFLPGLWSMTLPAQAVEQRVAVLLLIGSGVRAVTIRVTHC